MSTFAPLVNMTPELDALMPPAGPCGICGGPDQRHRLIDAIRENARAGDDPWVTWGPPGYPAGMVDAILALRPVRVQRSRAKGARLPWGARFVGRPSRWGNPFRPRDLDLHDRPLGLARAIELDRLATLRFIEDGDPADVERWLAPLRDATALACWCPLVDAHGRRVPCHVDTLLEVLA